MYIGHIIFVSYFIVGSFLVFYWYKRYYHKKYNELMNKGEVEKGAGELFFLFLLVFWPIVIIKNIIKHRTL
jgi:hypothetical protein